MKVEDPSALLVQWFYHKPTYLPKGDESSWQNCIKFAARSATTKRTFIAMEKIRMDIKSISARGVSFSGHQTPRRINFFLLGQKSIQNAPFAEKHCMCITIENTTFTTPAGTRNVSIPSLCQSLQLFLHRPCPNCSARRTLNGCAILSM